jgi:exosortase
MECLTKDPEITASSVASHTVSHLRVLGFVLICTLPFALAWNLTRELGKLALTNDSFSQILVIPFVSLFLAYENRKRTFAAISVGWTLGAGLIVPGLLCLVTARLNLLQLRPTNQIVVFMFGTVLIWLGAFGLSFGARAFQAARFPLLFLLFSVPIPEPLLSEIIRFLQRESADATAVFFQLAGVPYFRQGLIFQLPGISIRVAEECSGIRSSLALLITTVLASYLFLRSFWRKLLLCAVVVPLAILKNGLRIATLSTLAIYVNPGFLHGNLHYHGGIVFFALALVPMALLLMWLQKSEGPRALVRKRHEQPA